MCCKICYPSSLLFHQESATEKYQCSYYNSSMYVYLCAPLFQVSVSWSSEMQFCVTPWKHGIAHNPMLHSRRLYFSCLFFWGWGGGNVQHQILVPSKGQCLLWFMSNLFSCSCPWSDFEARFACLVLGLPLTLVWAVSVIILKYEWQEW